MCDKDFLENGGTLNFVPECYKNQEICNKAGDNYPHALVFVPECYDTQKMCDKAVDIHHNKYNMFLNAIRLKKCVIKRLIDVFFVPDAIPDQYKTQKTCDIVVSVYPFLIIYCPDKYKTQRMCDEVVDDSLVALELIPNWIFARKKVKNLYTPLYADDGLLFFMKILGMSHFVAMKLLFLV